MIDSPSPKADKQTIINCFLYLFNANATPQMRSTANQHLTLLETNAIQFLTNLLVIFEEENEDGLRLQAIVCFCNVVKRNWVVRRYSKAHSQFETLKKDIRVKLLEYICLRDKKYIKTQFNIIKFIVQKDYPQNFPTFTEFVHKMLQSINTDQTTILIFKQLKQIFYEIGERKGSISKKLFEDNFRGILHVLCELSIKLKDVVVSQAGNNTLSCPIIKLSKYMDQMILSILRVSPVDIMQEVFSQQLIQFLHTKLQDLLSAHSQSSKNTKALLQKNIKSLVYDLGLLQLSKPLILSWILRNFFDVLIYVLQNYQIFIKNDTIRYALIGLRRIVKQFSYYAEDNSFMNSIKSKAFTPNCFELRKICTSFYHESINPNTVEQLLNFLLFNPFNRSSKENSYFDIEEGSGVDRGKQKQLGIQTCVILLIEGLLERFTQSTHGLIKSLLANSLQNNWTNLDRVTVSNLLSVVAILPSTCKKNEQDSLRQIPVLQILQFIYGNISFKAKFASIVSGWISTFTNDQLNSLTGVLLDFIKNEGEGDIDQSALDLLMSCCQCLNKIVIQRASAIDLRALVQRVLPVSLVIFQNIDNPEILWPMVTLISNIIIKVQFDAQLIVDSVEPSKLSLLIGNQSPMLVEALCEMFKSFLCVIPRNMPARSVYELVCSFLNNHLSEFSSVNHEKIFHLWYITIREYSPIQGCQSFYIDLFMNHFRKNLYRKTATLVYILEQYMLSSLIPNQIDNFVALALECYMEADDLEKEEREKLKIASLSFQITLITKFNLQQVNSDQMLRLILQDMLNADLQVITATMRNSLLSIVNRYLILHQTAFFKYLQNIHLPLSDFFAVYLKTMQYLTSNTAMKINGIAILSLINNLDSALVLPHLHYILRILVPEVEKYYGTVQSGSVTAFIGKVDNSPSLRFASNTLSQRKEEVRRLDSFDRIDLGSAFRMQIGQFLSKSGISAHDVGVAFNDANMQDRFLKLI